MTEEERQKTANEARARGMILVDGLIGKETDYDFLRTVACGVMGAGAQTMQ